MNARFLSSSVAALTRRPCAVLGPLVLLASTACTSTSSPDAASPPRDASAATDAAPVEGATALDGSPISDAGVTDAPSVSDASSTCILMIAPDSGMSQWAAIGPDGHLTYATLSTGERLLDFSYAGYMGGGVAIPTVPAAATVSPSGGDDTSAIQDAINAVSAKPLTAGLRGAVVLAAGTFQLAGSLTISASGVVLRGAGSGAGGTTLNVTGNPRTVIDVAGAGSWNTSGAGVAITDSYVPSGTRSFHVADAGGLDVGQSVLVQRPVTEAWIEYMGMANLVRNGAPETWLAPGSVISADRNITAIDGGVVTIDAPLPDSLDAKYTAPSVIPYTYPGRIENVGVEGIHVVFPGVVSTITAPTFQFLTMDALLNGWIRDVVSDEAMSGISLLAGAKWVTVDGATMNRTAAIDGGAGWPFQFSVAGQQTLIVRSASNGTQSFPYATQARTSGPNVILDFTVTGASQGLEPHQRWATGLLSDNVTATASSIDYINRGYYGSGHGWTMGFGVVWNSVAETLVIEKPPGTTNWAIGSTGTYTSMDEPGVPDAGLMPLGTFDSKGAAVAPVSLYLAQLCERLGPAAVTNLGFTMP